MAVVKELEEEQQMAPIAVELMDNEMSMVYQKSNKSENDFREYPKILRQVKLSTDVNPLPLKVPSSA